MKAVCTNRRVVGACRERTRLVAALFMALLLTTHALYGQRSDFDRSAGDYTITLTIDDGVDSNAATTNVSVSQSNPPPAPVLYLAFEDDISDGVATDSSGNGLNLTCSGSKCPWYSPSEGFDGGAAYAFDGREHALEVNDPGSGWDLDITNAITIAAWVKPISTSGTQYIVSKDNIYEFRLSNGRSSARLNNGNQPSANTVVTPNTWQHVAFTWDGATRTYYYNGQPDGSDNVAGPLNANDRDVGVGARPGSASFTGMLDEVRVYDSALSAQEVLDLYNNAPLTPDTTSPLRLNGQPSGTIPSTTQAFLGVNTNEAATCRYATSAGISYDAMPNTFTTTGGMAHFEPLTGLQDGQSYSYYVRCRDTSGNQNTDDYSVSFTVDILGPPTANFNPQDLSPGFFIESVATFTNPHTNADCTAFEEPNYCCTGNGTGTCDQPVESFLVVNNHTRNIDCTAAGTPNACCSGFQTGTCAYEEGDMAQSVPGWQGNSYCPASTCVEGCVAQWVDQSGRKSPAAGHPITGNTFEQDDLEKPCYKTDCINSHACAVGHPAWVEPDYPPNEQPYQDATMEIEPGDRGGALGNCPGSFYLAQLVRIVPQTDDHYLLAGKTKYLVDENRIRFEPHDAAADLSGDGVLLPLPPEGEWYFIEVQRNPDLSMQLWVNEEDKTRSPTPTLLTLAPWSTQNFCKGKNCPNLNSQEFQGEAALMFYRCGSTLTAQEQSDFQSYVNSTYNYLDNAPPPPLRRYVATTGSDTGNDCTSAATPCRTLAHAVSQANDGDTLDMAAGTYNESGLVIEKHLMIEGPGVVVR